jgi:tetratricopeptide (TPR) repeat protein
MDDRTAKRTGYPLTIPDSLLHSDAMRRACLTRDFGEIFRLVNRRTGASYADIAAAIGKMTSSRISDVIRGVRRIRGQAVIERIADGFGIPGEMLDLPQRPWEGISPCESPQAPASRGNEVSFSSVIPERPESGGLSEMIRRDFLRLMSITNAVITAPDTFTCEEEGGSATARNTSAEAHERMNSHLWQVFSLSRSKRALQPVVREQLCELASSIRNTTSYREHRSLCAVAGSLFQLAGEIFFDSNHYAEAAHCYTLAAAASKEAEDFDLWACALTRHAFIGLYEREYGDTIPVLETAERIATRGDGQLSTRHWVAAVQAEVYARLGDYDACRRSLDKAEQVLSLGGGAHNGGWLRFDGSRLAEERGTCFVALDRFDLAEAALSEALRQPLSARRKGSALIDLAAIGVQLRDIDRVSTYARSAIELGRQTNSGYVGRKLQELRPRLRTLLPERRVARLDEEISALNDAI